MPRAEGRRYPYTAPRQGHGRISGGSKKAATDKSRGHISSVSGAPANKGSGVEPRTKANSKAQRPRGTKVAAPGGRKTRGAKVYPRQAG